MLKFSIRSFNSGGKGILSGLKSKVKVLHEKFHLCVCGGGGLWNGGGGTSETRILHEEFQSREWRLLSRLEFFMRSFNWGMGVLSGLNP